MSKLSLLTPTLFLPILLLAACGGSGSKTPTKPSETPSSSSVSSLSASSLSISSLSASSLSLSSLPIGSLSSSAISSSVGSAVSSLAVSSSDVSNSSSLASSSIANIIAVEKVSGVIEYSDTDGSAIDVDDAASVVITISLLNEQDQVVSTKSLSVLNAPGQTNSSLPFNGEVSGANAKFLVVQISKAGFTDYARRFAVAAELNIKATLSRVPMEKISASTTETISGASVDGFNFSVSDKSNPEEAGSSGDIADLTVSIPKSALPAGTTSIDVKMQAFNPNDAQDAERFPGAYADSDGNKLLSVAFNYTDITTNTGVSLRKLAANAEGSQSLLQKLGWNKTEAELIIINRKIPADSCTALKQMGDSSKELPGFQVPVYTYNSNIGLWDLLGQGTLYSDAGEPIADNFNAFDCSSTDYVLEIKVSNEIFLSNWWNLDYPLVFTAPAKLCADVQLVDEASNPIANTTVYIHDDDYDRSFSAENFVTDDDGKIHIETFSLDAVTTDVTVELMLYAKNYSSIIKKTITLSTSCAVSTPVVIKTILPAVCKVDGVVKDKLGEFLEKSPVYAIGDAATFAMPAYALTDSQGRYSLVVDCNQNYNLIDYFSWFANFSENSSVLNGYKFSVNGSISGNELLDNGKKAVLQDLIPDHSKPIGFVFSNKYENVNRILVEFFYAGNNYPLTYSFDAVDSTTNKVYGHFSGTLTKDDWKDLPGDDAWYMPFGIGIIPNNIVWPAELRVMTVKGEIKDAAGATSNLWGYLDNDEDDIDDEDEGEDEELAF